MKLVTTRRKNDVDNTWDNGFRDAIVTCNNLSVLSSASTTISGISSVVDDDSIPDVEEWYEV